MTFQSVARAIASGALLALCTVPHSVSLCSPESAAIAATAAPPGAADTCVKCHTDRELLKKIAVDKMVKSEATQGEG
jgi:hypothetical protein